MEKGNVEHQVMGGGDAPSQEQIVESVGTAAQSAGRFLVAGASRMTAATPMRVEGSTFLSP